jgi:citrate lyase subunit beta / citryl-CoA lyase
VKRISGVDARTWLLVPGDRPDQFSAPEVCEADALVLDLANNVAPENVSLARHAVARHLSGGGNAWVRVNGSDTDLCSGDLRAVVAAPGLRGVVLPRTESADQVRAVKAHLRAGVAIVAMLETAAGIENADGIAAARGTLRLAFGSPGLGRELGIAGGAAALLYARSRLVMASCAAGLPGPIDGPSVDVDDIVGLGEDLRHSVGLGFTGKLCLHPRQLCMTNSAFAPAPSKLAWARRVLAATRASPTSVIRVDGEMVDWQHIDDARHIVARAALFDPADARLDKRSCILSRTGVATHPRRERAGGSAAEARDRPQ